MTTAQIYTSSNKGLGEINPNPNIGINTNWDFSNVGTGTGVNFGFGTEGSGTGTDWWGRNQNTIGGIFGLLSQGLLTWAQFQNALKSGKTNVVASNGQQVDLSGINKMLEAQAKANQKSMAEMQQMFLMQMQAQQNANRNKNEKDNTLLYVGLGVLGFFVIGTGLYFLTKKK